MKEEIIHIQTEINAKGMDLKHKAGQMINAIHPVVSEKGQNVEVSPHGYLPPILWGISVLSLSASIIADKNNLLYALLCASTGIGAYYLGNQKKPPLHKKHNLSENNNLATKLVKVIRYVSDEWENFIEQEKQKVQALIQKEQFVEKKKDDLYFYTYVTEPIDFKAADIYLQMNKIHNSSNYLDDFSEFKKKLIGDLCTSIDRAAKKQIEKYDNLLKQL